MDACASCSDVSSGCAAPACGTTAVRSAIGRLAPAPRCRARRSSAHVRPPPPPPTPPPTAVGEPQEVEGLRFALSSTASVVPGEAPELDQPRLLRMQLQPELLQPL